RPRLARRPPLRLGAGGGRRERLFPVGGLTPLAPLSHPLPTTGRGGKRHQRSVRSLGGGAPLPAVGRGWERGGGRVSTARLAQLPQPALGWGGISNQNVLPCCSAVCTPIVPACCSTIALQMARPRPVPPRSRLSEESICWNLPKIRCS